MYSYSDFCISNRKRVNYVVKFNYSELYLKRQHYVRAKYADHLYSRITFIHFALFVQYVSLITILKFYLDDRKFRIENNYCHDARYIYVYIM